MTPESCKRLSIETGTGKVSHPDDSVRTDVKESSGRDHRHLHARLQLLEAGFSGMVLRSPQLSPERSPPDTFVNIAEQYHPCGLAHEFSQLDRQITAEEYGQALALADKVAHPKDGLATGED